ncbi:hypothetical protein AKJ57_04295 [candidate division MSBL1 archaeon SCGC-AAA259A05]|uniref:N-acetyltransferase domain-containing protein n=1 Tax=candidate division MSBL1 archaeon SCGC-AAA259A05 TaxID=1698259 RepID=A0A133U7S4_9EURY|nr:hypothetical protein AKJ57_04295 [candidate division MSBL1 archaeon SCGC-AAA259A05]
MTFFVYTAENEIVGVAALNIENKEVGKVRWVHVLPEYRKQGIGTNLMRHVERKAKSRGIEKLAVQYVHNKAYWARNFYSDLGYKKERKVSHPQGQCFIYEKEIEENKPSKTS